MRQVKCDGFPERTQVLADRGRRIGPRPPGRHGAHRFRGSGSIGDDLQTIPWRVRRHLPVVVRSRAPAANARQVDRVAWRREETGAGAREGWSLVVLVWRVKRVSSVGTAFPFLCSFKNFSKMTPPWPRRLFSLSSGLDIIHFSPRFSLRRARCRNLCAGGR